MSSGDDPGSARSLAPPAPDAVIRYAAHNDGLIDVHLPRAPRRPHPRLVVLLHGGFWKQAYDRRHARAAAAALAAEGFVVASPEYRRVGGGGGWPATAEDVAQAVALAPSLLTGLAISSEGLTVVGHSAGGHLALWLANQPQPVDLVVGLAPVADLRAAARDRLGGRATQALLGGEPDEVPQAYAAADPRTRMTAARPRCAVRIVHGSRDDVVPVGNSRGLAESQPFVDLRVVEGADHFDVMDPTSAAWTEVLAALAPPG